MLVLARKRGEWFRLVDRRSGLDLGRILLVRGEHVRIGFDLPEWIDIRREELVVLQKESSR